MLKGATKKIRLKFNLDPAVDLSAVAVTKLVAYIIVNGVCYLKFTKVSPAPTGYDGVIAIDGTDKTIAYIYITREQSLTLAKGKLSCEALITRTDANYGASGEALIVFPDLDFVENSFTITE